MGEANGRFDVWRVSGSGCISGTQFYCKGTGDITDGGSNRCGSVVADSDAVNERRERHAGR